MATPKLTYKKTLLYRENKKQKTSIDQNKKMKTKTQKERRKRWLRKHPELRIKRLEKWILKEKNPQELEKAKTILQRYQEKIKK